MENTSVQIYENFKSVSDIEKIGTIIAKSGFAGCDKIEQGQAIALILLSEKISLTQYSRTYDLIGGKPRKKALAAAAEFRQRGGKIKWIATGDDGIKAVAELTHEGQTIKVEFTIEQAKKQGLVRGGGNWEKTPGNMLRARVLSNGIAMLAPEIFAGQDDGSEFDEPTKPELKLAKTEVVTAEPAEEQKVIDVETSTQTEKQVSVSFKAGTTGSANLLNAATVAKLTEVLSEIESEAYAFFLSKSWVRDGEGLEHISLKRAQAIIDAPEKFIAAVKGAAK